MQAHAPAVNLPTCSAWLHRGGAGRVQKWYAREPRRCTEAGYEPAMAAGANTRNNHERSQPPPTGIDTRDARRAPAKRPEAACPIDERAAPDRRCDPGLGAAADRGRRGRRARVHQQGHHGQPPLGARHARRRHGRRRLLRDQGRTRPRRPPGRRAQRHRRLHGSAQPRHRERRRQDAPHRRSSRSRAASPSCSSPAAITSCCST